MVVVEHGKNGKKDKYYIIPGGAPVIFEDEDGNELTRYVELKSNPRGIIETCAAWVTSADDTSPRDVPGRSSFKTSTAVKSAGASRETIHPPRARR